MFRWPHFFGYRITLPDSRQLLIVGRNYLVPVKAVLFVFLMTLPGLLFYFEDTRAKVEEEPIAILPMMVLFGVATWAAPSV